MPKLFLIRGLPGSGKSTFAKKIAKMSNFYGEFASVFEADQYFMVNGEYKFDASKLSEAHRLCRDKTREALVQGNTAIVANTFTTKKELKPYIEMAKELDAELTILTVNGNHGSIHGVPEEQLKKMKARFEHDISDIL